MFTSLDVLYIVASICLVAITVSIIMLATQAMQVLRDVNRISQNVEEITVLVEKVAQVVFPGILQVAKKTNQLEEKVEKFIRKKVNQIIS